MTDKKIICSRCGEEFTFTTGEQEFYAEHGFSDPKKCEKCRKAAKEEKNK